MSTALEVENKQLKRKVNKLKEVLRRQVNTLCRAIPKEAPIFDYIVLDTETTGLNCSYDEILQLSIIDSDNNVLMDRYIKPLLVDSWPEAEKIHKISQEQVRNEQNIYSMAVAIQKMLNQTTKIVGYNVGFDLAFLKYAGFDLTHIAKVDDVMMKFSEIYGEYNEYYGDYKWQKLITCANYYNYNWDNCKAHNSLGDCLATNFCYKKMTF